MMGRHELAVGMQSTCEMPDMFGLQEHFVTEIRTEIDGPNVRIVCGAQKGGQLHWLYSCVMRCDQLEIAAHQLVEAAKDARGAMRVMAGRGH
jgi:hypothetical protein